MKDFFLRSFEKILNQYVMLDPESLQRLKPLEGKVITLELSGLNVILQLKILRGRLYLQKSVETQDVLIKGTPLFLLHLTLNKKNRKQFFAEDVMIEGDLELGQQMIDLFDELEIDWEEHLSHIVGDVASHQIGNAVRKIKIFSQKTHEALTQSLNEYVHEEIDFFPTKEALQDFFHDIDEARMDVDRLEQKIKGMQE